MPVAVNDSSLLQHRGALEAVRLSSWRLPALAVALCLAARIPMARMGKAMQWVALPLFSSAAFLSTIKGQASVAVALLIGCGCINALLLLWWLPPADLPRSQINISLLVWWAPAGALALLSWLIVQDTSAATTPRSQTSSGFTVPLKSDVSGPTWQLAWCLRNNC
jgi:hypothetical protein